jgi:GH15 family glucan-1,4-alpha-glucosidase
MSIWEVRSRKQNYTYSKIMLWVAFDRGLRLAEKRCLPCPNRAKWLETRDEIYEDIMTQGKYPYPTDSHLHAKPIQAIVTIYAASYKVTSLATSLTPQS